MYIYTYIQYIYWKPSVEDGLHWAINVSCLSKRKCNVINVPSPWASFSWILAGIQRCGGGRQNKHNILKTWKKKKECYNLHKKHKVLDSNNVIKTLLNFSFFLLCPCQDVNPAIMYGLRLFASFLPIWDWEANCRFPGKGNAFTVGIASALHMDCAKPSDTSYLAPWDNQPSGFVLEVTENTQVASFRSLESFFAWRPQVQGPLKVILLFSTFKMNEILSRAPVYPNLHFCHIHLKAHCPLSHP